MGKGGSSTAAVEAPAVRGAKGKLVARTDFFWDDNDEPHAARRKAIMKAHPEVSKLTGPEWRSKYICLFALVLPQIWLSVVTADLPWLPYLAIAYVFGATITQVRARPAAPTAPTAALPPRCASTRPSGVPRAFALQPGPRPPAARRPRAPCASSLRPGSLCPGSLRPVPPS